jgi:hypothetical protein
MTKDWNKNMRKRSHKHGSLLFPTLKEKITAQDLKRVFSYCALNIAKKRQTNVHPTLAIIQ